MRSGRIQERGRGKEERRELRGFTELRKTEKMGEDR